MAIRIPKNPAGISLDDLFFEEIDSVKNATDAEGISIDSSVMRNKAETEFVGLLKLEDKYVNAWKDYYAKQKEIRVSKGLSPTTPTLELNDAQVKREARITVKQARELKTAIAKEMGIKDTKSIQIGHADHGVAMDRAKIIYDNARVITDKQKFDPNSGVFGITREQKAYIGKAIVAAQAIERAPHSQITELKKRFGVKKVTNDVLIAYLNTVNEEIKINANFLLQTTKNGPKLQYDFIFQSKEHNQDSGDLTKLLGKNLGNLLRAVDKDTIKTFKNSDFAWALMNVPGSYTMFERVNRFLNNIILGKRSKDKPSKHSKEAKIVNKASGRLESLIAKVKKAKRETLARIRRTKIEEPKVPVVGIFNVMGLINFVLGNEIRAQMGKSSDPPTRLRWQTGRFADSAKLIALKESRGKPMRPGVNTPPLVGIYTYLHYPYDVFLPGHPLDNGLRDPRVYIEHGIRAAARTILESRYPGMILEPD